MNSLCFVSDDDRFGVKIPSGILESIIKECMKDSKHETGGVLIGRYSKTGKWACISESTGPTVDSRKGRSSFKRGIFGLISLLDSKWNSKSEFYIGEWHYHPNASPIPSFIDIKQMKQIASHRGLNCPEPVLIIVGGSESIGWKFSASIFLNTEYIRLSEYLDEI